MLIANRPTLMNTARILTCCGLAVSSRADVPGDGPDLYVDTSSGFGTLTIDGNGPFGFEQIIEPNNANIGFCENGTLIMRDEGLFDVGGDLNFGTLDGAFGEGDIGDRSVIRVGGSTRIGFLGGEGELTLRGGSVFETAYFGIAQPDGSRGVVEIRGANTLLRTFSAGPGLPAVVHVGQEGPGTLLLENGGRIETNLFLVGRAYDSNQGNGTFTMGGISNVTGDRATISAVGIEFSPYDSGVTSATINDESLIQSSDYIGIESRLGGTSTLAISGHNTDIETEYFGIGQWPTATVDVTLSDRCNVSVGSFVIGIDGNASCIVESGASITATGNVDVAFVSNEVGRQGQLTLRGSSTVDGTPSTINCRFFGVANFGEGTGFAIVEDGAILTVTESLGVDGNLDAPGLISVRGALTTVSAPATFIGGENPGRLEILGGASYSGTTLLARAKTPGQYAELEVNGGSTMAFTDRVDFGDFGNATVALLNGSSLRATGLIGIAGNGGTADVLVESGSEMITQDIMYIGAWPGGDAVVTVTGIDTKIGTEGPGSVIRVGHRGRGDLSVLSGASAESEFVTIGAEETGNGTALVAGLDPISGTPSTLRASRSLNVGRGDGGVGSLEILNGGLLETPLMWIGQFEGSVGAVEVSGSGSTLTGFGGNPTLVIGESGDGSLSVLQNGLVEWQTVRIGALSGSRGTVNVDAGELQSLGSQSQLLVGVDGDGSLSFDSASKAAWNVAIIAQGAKSDGAIELDGSSSLMLNVGSLIGGAVANGLDTGDGEVRLTGTSQFVSPSTYVFGDGRLIGGASPSQMEAQVVGDVFSNGLIRVSDAAPGGVFRIDGDLGPRFGRYGQIRLAINSLDGTPVHQKLSILGNADLDGSVVITASSPLTVSDPMNIPPISIIEAGSFGGGNVFSQVESLPPVAGPGGEQFYLRPFFTPQGVSLEVVTLSDLLSVDDLGGPTGLGGTNNAAIATGFLNGDSFEDIVVAQASPTPGDPDAAELPGFVLVLLSNGDGTFTVNPLGSLGIGPRSVTVGDFDADGDQDIAVGNSGSARPASLEPARIRFLFNDGNGAFTMTDTGAAGTFRYLEIDDVTTPDGTFRGIPVSLVSDELLRPPNAGANAEDLATVIDYDTAGVDVQLNGLLIVAGRGEMALDDWEEICELPTGPRPGNAAIADPDGPASGFGNSIAVPIGADGDLAFYANTDPINGDFSSQPQIAAVGADPREARAGDLDGDGLDDLVVLNAADGTLSILPNGSGIGGDIYARVADLPISGQNDPDSPDDNPKAIALAQGSTNGPLDLFVIAPDDGGTMTVRGINNISTPGNFDFISVEDIPGTVPMGESPALLNDADVRGVGNEDLVVLTDVGRGPSSVLRVFPPTPECPADLAPPFGTLDLADISAFVTAFTTNDLSVDFDNNGVLDLADITVLVSSFTGGCN